MAIRVLSLISHVSSTSIPVDIMDKISELYPVDVSLVAFYDSDIDSIDLELEGMEIDVIPLTAESRFDISAYRMLYKLLQNTDILHTHDNFIGSVARVLAAASDTSIVNTEHGSHERFTLLQNLVNAATLPLADTIIPNSHATNKSFKWYENLLLHSTDRRVIYNGVDLDRIDAAKPEANRRSSNDLRLISVGRLIDVKNYSTLLQSFAAISTEIPNIRLIIVGDGPKKEELRKLSKQLHIADNVCFTGHLPRNEVYKLLHQCDLFVLLSRSEGFCVAAVEAMAAGLPVVVSDLDVFYEVVDGNGIYVNPNDPTEISSKLLSFIESESCRKKHGKDAKAYARKTYSLDITATKYYSIYSTVVNEK